jgi:glycosyltransferase involved in cell wall biosynthesis
MPAYNAEKTITASIQSVIDQSYASWNLTIIDDGSKDQTYHVAKDMAKDDIRINVIRQKNAGPSSARNHGLNFLRHNKFIAFLNAGDIWHKDKLIKHVIFFDANPKIDIAFARVQFFTDEISANNPHSNVGNETITIEQALADNPACTISNLIIRKHVFEEIGGFAEHLSFAEDQEWTVRAIAAGFLMGAINRTLVYYRYSLNSLSSDIDIVHRGWKAMINSLKKAKVSISPDTIARADAINNRTLTRRSLKLGLPNSVTARYLSNGLQASVAGFFDNFERGSSTIAAALVSFMLPKNIQRQLFSEK